MREVDLVGVGFGPSNIAVAVAGVEVCPEFNMEFFDVRSEFAWHPDLMFPDAEMQVPFLKDLVTMRNPRSAFSFLEYLRAKTRLHDFINLRTFFPSRVEFSDYYRWVADQFSDCVHCGRRVVRVARADQTHLEVVTVDAAGFNEDTVLTRSLVLADGGKPHIPGKTVLVVGKGFDAYRGYNLDELKAAGRTVWLVDDQPPESSNEYEIDRFFTADFSQPAHQQALDLAAEIGGIDVEVGICYIESLLPWAADFFAPLGVEFISAEQALLVRSKHQLRTAFEGAGLPTPRHRRGGRDELMSTSIEYPVIVKPEFGYSSIGVELITSHDELVRYFDRDNNVSADTYVVEAVIEGREFSIEGYARDGVVTAAALTTKFKTRLPYFEELAHYCSRLIEVSPRQREFFEKTIAALGISTSPFHCEFFEGDDVLTPVEVGARLAGDKIPYLHRRVTGRSMLLDYLGDDIVFEKEASEGLGIVFFVPKAPGVVADSFPPEGLAESLGEHFFEAPAGRTIKSAPDDFFVRLGFCLVEANTAAEFAFEANRRIDLYERASGIDLHRLDPPVFAS